jgi:hypothetical protein
VVILTGSGKAECAPVYRSVHGRGTPGMEAESFGDRCDWSCASLQPSVKDRLRRPLWAALGDPVGPEERIADLVRLSIERCADFGGVPVFYEVTSTHQHCYADFGSQLTCAGHRFSGEYGQSVDLVLRQISPAAVKVHPAAAGSALSVIPAR